MTFLGNACPRVGGDPDIPSEKSLEPQNNHAQNLIKKILFRKPLKRLRVLGFTPKNIASEQLRSAP